MRSHHSDTHSERRGRFFERLSSALIQHAQGRHERGGRGGHHGRGFRHGGADGWGDEGDFPRSRKFSSDDLQLLLLALLAEQASHGYELSRALEERSNGFYKPSPGMIYPALTYLEEIGYATVEVVSNKKCYQLAPAGRAYLDAHRAEAEAMLARLAYIGRKMDALRASMRDRSPDEAEGERGWLPEYVAARRALRHLLATYANASAPEQLRIAAILERAAAEIRGDGSRTAQGPAAPATV